MSQYSDIPAAKNHPSASDLLEKDVAALEAIIGNPTVDIQTKEWATHLASRIKQSRIMNAHFAEVAEQLGARNICEQFTNEEIANLMALPKEGEESALHQVIERSFLNPNLERLGELSKQEVDQFLDYICCVFGAALSDEYLSRRANIEKAPGRAVREMIVEQGDQERASRLESVAQRVIAPHRLSIGVLPPLAFPQSVGNDSFSVEARAEAHSMAIESLAGEASGLSAGSTPAAEPRFFESALNGSFDKAFWRTRDHVAGRIDTELGHGDLMAEGDAPKTDQNDSGRTLFEEIRADPDTETILERKILVEQLLTSPVLAPEERKVLISMFVGDRTEEATAAVMQISQSQVSKIKSKGLAKLRSRINT
jgi:Sigma-70, region 4